MEAPNPSDPIRITEDMLYRQNTHAEIKDFESGMSRLPKVTLFLMGVNTAVFIWEMTCGALESKEAIIQAGALVRHHVGAGELWRLFTAIFLHGSLDHLIGNCVCLYIVGMACEHAFKATRFMWIYILSGLTGSLLSVAIQPGPSVGASGAVFGIIGACIIFFYKMRNVYRLRDKRIGVVLFLWALYQIACGFLSPYIDNLAHIGGFLGGGIVGMIIGPNDNMEACIEQEKP